MLSAASCNNWWMKDILKTDDFVAEQKLLVEAVVSEEAKETVEAKVIRLILSNLKPPSPIAESYQLDKEI